MRYTGSQNRVKFVSRFLSNSHGPLSKTYIDTLQDFYGEDLARLCFYHTVAKMADYGYLPFNRKARDTYLDGEPWSDFSHSDSRLGREDDIMIPIVSIHNPGAGADNFYSMNRYDVEDTVRAQYPGWFVLGDELRSLSPPSIEGRDLPRLSLEATYVFRNSVSDSRDTGPDHCGNAWAHCPRFYTDHAPGLKHRGNRNDRAGVIDRIYDILVSDENSSSDEPSRWVLGGVAEVKELVRQASDQDLSTRIPAQEQQSIPQ